MARKRGGKTGPLKESSRSRKRNQEGRWNDRSEIPMNEIDEFHASRDRVLLGVEEARSDSEEEEVFALKGLAEESDDEEDEEDVEQDNEVLATTVKTGTSKKTSKPASSKKKGMMPPSDSGSDSEEHREESWGTKKSAYYSSNAAQIESDDEEAHDMEEQEALRIQARLREGLREEDFGIDDALRVSFNPAEVNDDTIFENSTSKVSQVQIKDRASAIRHLQTNNPETLALIQEWDDIVALLLKTESRLNSPEWLKTKSPATLGLIHMHYQSLLIYANLLAFYFYLRASERYAQKPETLRNHAITRRLLVLKETLTTMQDLEFALSGSETDVSDEDDFDDLDLSEEGELGLEEYLLSKARNSNTTEIEAALLKARSESSSSKTSKKAEKLKKKKVAPSSNVNTVIFDVEEPTLSKSQQSSKVDVSASDGFGEATALDLADVADKNVRKKALRFHTAKIDSSSARRANARFAIGGDDDIPYRERKKQQQARAFENAKNSSTLGQGGDDLDDVDPEVENSNRKRHRGEEDSDDDLSEDDVEVYYSLVKKRKNKEKAEKKARYEEVKAANAINYAEVDADGQRSVSRAILKNKGLTPKRSNSVRNPRVKKRQRFEKAKKKLASQKSVYKGPGDASRYDGERSGISKVVKSVKL